MKKTWMYIITIISLVIVLILLWILFINTTKSDSSDNTQTKSNSSTSYTSSTTITEDKTITSGSYKSNNSDENVILVDNATAKISNIEVSKTGDSDGGDSTSFYGTNSAILAKCGANLTLKNVTITTDATGANGVFSYGGSATTNNSSSDGTTVNISNSGPVTILLEREMSE